MIIYLISRKSDGRAYVGQTSKSLKVRLAEHIRNDANGIGAAIRRQGRGKFVAVVLAECETCEANRLERLYINLLHAMEPSGYNLKPGGNGHQPSRRLRHRTKKAQKREPVFYPIDDLDYEKTQQEYFDSMSV